MPTNPALINLLGNDELSSSPYARVVSWALTYGRYIMIGTEIVVLLAFLSRFSLDRKLTDLREEIEQKQVVINVNQELETDIRFLQDHIVKIKSLMYHQAQTFNHLSLVTKYIPPDVTITSFDATKEKVTVDVIAGTTGGLHQFLTDLQKAPYVNRVDIGDMRRNPVTGIEFKLTLYVKQ